MTMRYEYSSRRGLLQGDEEDRNRAWCRICAAIAVIMTIVSVVFIALYASEVSSKNDSHLTTHYPTTPATLPPVTSISTVTPKVTTEPTSTSTPSTVHTSDLTTATEKTVPSIATTSDNPTSGSGRKRRSVERKSMKAPASETTDDKQEVRHAGLLPRDKDHREKYQNHPEDWVYGVKF